MTTRQAQAALVAEEVQREYARERAREDEWMEQAVRGGNHVKIIDKEPEATTDA